jgi:hypothetical protein
MRARSQARNSARQQAVAALERAFAARENSQLSKAQIAPIQWTAIVVLASLILAITAMIHCLDQLHRQPCGFFGPTAVGWIKDYTGSFAGGLYALAALGPR